MKYILCRWGLRVILFASSVTRPSVQVVVHVVVHVLLVPLPGCGHLLADSEVSRGSAGGVHPEAVVRVGLEHVELSAVGGHAAAGVGGRPVLVLRGGGLVG